jgi:Amidase
MIDSTSHAMTDTHYYLDVNELQHRVRTRDISPIHIVEQCLERIQRLNARLNAFAVVLADEARAQAQRAHDEIEHGRWRGPLHGLPVVTHVSRERLPSMIDQWQEHVRLRCGVRSPVQRHRNHSRFRARARPSRVEGR